LHIPDGYLSPSTCAVMYAASAGCWWAALRRTRRKLMGRTLPLLALFAAFAFVIMMFNLPLPGGTTGHAVGTGIAAIVLGPWASMLAISLALAIQALFFGDGGISTLGANCFNMAIAGSVAAWAIFRIVGFRAEAGAPRRMIAAAAAGYGAINLSALLAAIELGLQPMLFRDATGAPLYAPYSLRIAIPAMMIGHLTIAGAAEALMCAGLFGFLQRHEPALLPAAGAGGYAATDAAPAADAQAPAAAARAAGRGLWGVLAMILLLTPLGILAGGAAWSEWAPKQFSDPAARAQIAAASGNAAPPSTAPAGMARMAKLWTAPLPEYAPHFVKSAAFGYLLSAMFGVGLILGAAWLAQRLTQAVGPEGAP
jgi:cobalt/nickel transport system permease protein